MYVWVQAGLTGRACVCMRVYKGGREGEGVCVCVWCVGGLCCVWGGEGAVKGICLGLSFCVPVLPQP